MRWILTAGLVVTVLNWWAVPYAYTLGVRHGALLKQKRRRNHEQET